MENSIFFPLLLGLLRRDKVDGDRWALLSRVSTGPQMAGQSTERQLDNLEKEVNSVDGDVRKEVEVAESAATVKRESLEEIAVLAEEDEIDVVGVSKLDRLTRADPWESFEYLKRLKEADVILYAGTHGYFDWDDLYDFQMLVRQVVFSREWYQRIRDNARDGQIGKLEQGKWPFGQPPFGYYKDEDDYVLLTEQGEAIIPEIFELYRQEQNRAEVKRTINDRYNRTVSDSQLKTLLRSRLCLGQLTLEGEVIKENPQLAVIDLEVFNAVQEILDRRSSVPTGTRAVPRPVERAAEQYGEEYVLTLIDSIDTQCRKCGGDLQHNGDIERWGTKLKNYVCQDCDHQGPLLTQEEFNALHDTLPLRCPSCPETEHFEIDQNKDGDWDYSYTCLRCDNVFGTDLLPDKYQRGFERPDLKFTWSGETSTDQVREDQIGDEDDESGLNQVLLTDF
ncbi:recombinase family protein [Halostagnicola larsenii]|nr:recombinase family protein [Halostagnicola larsenii]